MVWSLFLAYDLCLAEHVDNSVIRAKSTSSFATPK
jgi:hypothetical protein